jgi:glyoxylase-like metal-dependent hydrolase (beta-lactamase superfamily II)
MLMGAGGNIGVSAGDDGIVVIDDQYAPLAPKIKEALRTISDKPIKFIINTHYHGDHTGGNVEFGREAPIVAQTNVRKRLASGSKIMGRDTPPAPAVALPILTYDDTVTVHVNGEDIRATYYPNGHTDGDSIIFFPQANVIHMGDDFFNGHFPFIDVDNGGSAKGMLAAVDKVLATMPADAKVIPGHGDLSDKAGLQKFADMLRGTQQAVAAALKAGKSLDQMKKDKVLAKWDAFNWNFISADTFTELLYREQSSAKKK